MHYGCTQKKKKKKFLSRSFLHNLVQNERD